MNSIHRSTLALLLALGAAAQTKSDYCATYDPAGDPLQQRWSGAFIWNSTYDAIQQNADIGGWLSTVSYNFSSDDATNFNRMASRGTGRLRLDLAVHADSFAGGHWTNGAPYQVECVASSLPYGGSSGPFGIMMGAFSVTGTNDQALHIDVSFDQLNWFYPDQIYGLDFVSYSDDDKPLHFYISNVCAYEVEPCPCVTKLELQRYGNDLVLTWQNTNYHLMTATSLHGPFTPVLGATSPYTNPMSASQQFFISAYPGN